MDVEETDLPGVGRKFEVAVGDGESLVVVIHNTGKRELFHRPSPDADSEKVVELTDEAARTVSAIIEGAQFQPVASERAQTRLGEETLLEWFRLDADSPVVGQTLAAANLRQRTGATVITIERGESVLPSPDAETTIEAGDTLVVVGDRESVEAMAAVVAGEDDA